MHDETADPTQDVLHTLVLWLFIALEDLERVHRALKGRLKMAAMQLLQPALAGLHARRLAGLLGPEDETPEHLKQWPSELNLVRTAAASAGAGMSTPCIS